MFFILGMILFSSFVVSSDYFGVGRNGGNSEDSVYTYGSDGTEYHKFGFGGSYWWHAEHIDFGDFDGDGYDDAISLVNEDGDWFIYDLHSEALIWSHENIDGFGKVVFGNVDDDLADEFGVYSNNGLGVYDSDGTLVHNADPGSFQLSDFDFGDVDGDGKDELGMTFSSGGSEMSRWRIYDFEEGVVPGELLMYGGKGWGPYAKEIAFGDFDGDGKDEFSVITSQILDVDGSDKRSCLFFQEGMQDGNGEVPESLFLDIPLTCVWEGYCYLGDYDDCRREAEYIAFGDFDDDGYDDFGFVQYEERFTGSRWVFNNDFINITSLRDCLGQSECEALAWAYSGHGNMPIYTDIDIGRINGKGAFGASAKDVLSGVDERFAWIVYDEDNFGAYGVHLLKGDYGTGYNGWSFAFANAPGDEIDPEEEPGTDCVGDGLGVCCNSPNTCSNEVPEGTGCDKGVCCNSAGECTSEPPECILSDTAMWLDRDTGEEITDVDEGELVKLSIEGSGNCDGKIISLELFDDDIIDMDPVEPYNFPSQMIFEGTRANVFWFTEWHQDTDNGWGDDDPEYVFRASLEAQFVDSGKLKVKTDNVYLFCNEFSECDQGVGVGVEDECEYVSQPCEEGSTDCGDGVIEGDEQCDCGDPWDCDEDGLNGRDCTYFGVECTEGEIDCYEPEEEEECTFSIGTCEGECDDPIDIPEDGSDTYTVTGECICEPTGDPEDCPDGIGTRQVTVYYGNGDPPTDYDQECFLVTEDVPFISIVSILITLLILSIFYYRKE